ncbi:MAG: energy transducer TonB [Pseudomonadota bacterium]
MSRFVEVTVFSGLAIALHIAAFATAGPRGSESEGASGDTLISLAGASMQTAAMVQEWDELPDAQVEVPVTPNKVPEMTNDLPTLSLPDTPVARPTQPVTVPSQPIETNDIPQIDTASAEPPPRYAPSTSERPTARRDPQPQTQPPRAEQRAAGSGGGRQAGQSGQAATSTLSSGRAAELQAVWGAQIRSRIENRKRYPAGARGSGQVVVSLSVSRDGQLLNANIRQSSGNAAFDQAALRAVSSAGRFPAAPSELQSTRYRFALTVSFSR